MTSTWRVPAFARTTAFKLTLLSAALFALSSFAILALVYGASVGAAIRRADASITTELAAIEARYVTGGLQGVNRYVVQRSVGGSEFLYLLTAANGRRVSGNLSGIPEANPDIQGRVHFQYDRAPIDEVSEDPSLTPTGRAGRGRITTFEDGYVLFVGLDVEEETRFVSNMLNAVLAASGLSLGLGIISGAVVSRRFAKRLEAINVAARQVMAGDLQTRTPRTYSGDDLDELSGNFNAMLDRVEHLMHRMRSAGDSIAHDLRMPLTRMRGRLETALVQGGTEGDYEAALAQAVNDTEELLKTFNAVLSLSRLQAGERRKAMEVLNPSEILADVAEMYEPVCEDVGLEFTAEIERDLSLTGDRELIAQAAANLIDNAVKYTPEGGAVCLRARRCSNGAIEISVTDTGPGIPAEDRARVLERFVRLEKSRSQPGVGLGLSLVQAIAELHRADLTLDDGPGEVEGAREAAGPGLRVALVFPPA
ncbi:sensor histidine kinase [Woodsholea maritima]|uniref:sensor histidine kinase n=1 Tax=Woodsholea maritima TaxID=240237 RepID=UPI0003A1DBEB|nr:ATP-binding protein [Woodsholea maritima]